MTSWNVTLHLIRLSLSLIFTLVISSSFKDYPLFWWLHLDILKSSTALVVIMAYNKISLLNGRNRIPSFKNCRSSPSAACIEWQINWITESLPKKMSLQWHLSVLTYMSVLTFKIAYEISHNFYQQIIFIISSPNSINQGIYVM